VWCLIGSGHREFVRWGKLIEGDIRNGTALEVVFSTYKMDAVMHFAALAFIGESFVIPSDYCDVNVHGTRVLLDAMTIRGQNYCVLIQLRYLR
jgi:UDP-arabinose 4-epimerase